MEQRVKEILEKVKASAVTAAEMAGKAAGAAGKKAGGFVETTKLNLQIFDLNTDIDLAFKEIGKNIYATHIGEEVPADIIESKLAEIDGKYARISEIKGEIALKKSTEKCPSCGKTCDREDIYCRYCGTML